jgi:hypothetical protein
LSDVVSAGDDDRSGRAVPSPPASNR